MSKNLLIVEDDIVLRSGLAELFTREGYIVIEAGSMFEARHFLESDPAYRASNAPGRDNSNDKSPYFEGSAHTSQVSYRRSIDAVILDVSLPDGDGVSLCRAWRSNGIMIPVLFLTARDEEYDIVRGLDSGGNDYVTKPFRLQELLSRVRVLVRDSSSSVSSSHGDFTIDETHMQILKKGVPISLTLTEYKIAKLLMENSGIVTRNILLDILWDNEGRYIDDNTLSVHISRLREKVGAEHIKTIRGVGYQWSDI